MASKHYVNNKQLFTSMIEYQRIVRECREAGTEIPKMPNYIGECIYHIANRLSLKPNFANYPFRDEMVSDGIENCLLYWLDNFNADKTSNPFAYFTQIIKFAFFRRIEKEKKQLYIKQKSLHNLAHEGLLVDSSEDFDMQNINSLAINLDNEYMSNLVVDFEHKAGIRKNKVNKAKGLEIFYEDTIERESSHDSTTD